MNKKTKEALLLSIEKWKQIENGEMIDDGANNCALCEAFHEDMCKGCPVAKATQDNGCHNTPYQWWGDEQFMRGRRLWNGDLFIADTPELVKLASAERKFLESLLPK